MQITATKRGMKQFTTEELLAHVASVDAKVAAAPAIIRRNAYSRWSSNRSAILREVSIRENA
jgi:hypothetical protein